VCFFCAEEFPISPDSLNDELVIIQRNPHSGSGAGRIQLRILSHHLRRAGFRVRMFSSRPRLDHYLKHKPAHRVLRCIVAAGGDGTVADLVNRHPGVPIAVLPLGTENLLAKFLSIRRCGRRLAEVIQRGKVRIFDSAIVNGRRILLMASVGIDAEIVEAVHQARTGHIHRVSYVRHILGAFLANLPILYRVVAESGAVDLSGCHIIVTNVPRYGFDIPFAPKARPDDGVLDVRVFHGTTRWQVFWHVVRLRLGLPVASNEFTRFSASAVRIECLDGTKPRTSQCDGDPGPELPLQIVTDHHSLTLIVP
jgi:diacylglycerol kinase (ATP)